MPPSPGGRRPECFACGKSSPPQPQPRPPRHAQPPRPAASSPDRSRLHGGPSSSSAAGRRRRWRDRRRRREAAEDADESWGPAATPLPLPHHRHHHHQQQHQQQNRAYSRSRTSSADDGGSGASSVVGPVDPQPGVTPSSSSSSLASTMSWADRLAWGWDYLWSAFERREPTAVPRALFGTFRCVPVLSFLRPYCTATVNLQPPPRSQRPARVASACCSMIPTARCPIPPSAHGGLVPSLPSQHSGTLLHPWYAPIASTRYPRARG